jgi:hypothetical protein
VDLFVWIFTARQHITGHIVPNAIKGLKMLCKTLLMTIEMNQLDPRMQVYLFDTVEEKISSNNYLKSVRVC